MSYGGDVNRGPFLNAIDWVFASIALVFVALRLISQSSLREKRQWAGIDEAFVILPMAVILVRSIYISYCVHLGFGQHLQALAHNPVQMIQLTRLLVILQAISLWTWALPKLSVALLLYRVFGTYKKRLGLILFSSVGLLLIFVVIMTIVTFVKCTPIEKNWNPMGVAGTCWDTDIYHGIGYFAGALSAALDFGFAIYAMTQVFSLQMDHSRKIMIAISLSLGIPAGIVTCIKLSAIHTLNVSDVTFSTVELEVWNSVESCALMVAASVPSIRTMIIMMGVRIKQWTSLFSTRDTAQNSAKKQSEFSEDSSYDKRNAQVDSAELQQFRGASYSPLVD